MPFLHGGKRFPVARALEISGSFYLFPFVVKRQSLKKGQINGLARTARCDHKTQHQFSYERKYQISRNKQVKCLRAAPISHVPGTVHPFSLSLSPMGRPVASLVESQAPAAPPSYPLGGEASVLHLRQRLVFRWLRRPPHPQKFTWRSCPCAPCFVSCGCMYVLFA